AALGILGTFWLVRTIPSMIPRDVLPLDGVNVDTTVLLFALLTSVATGLLFGIAPSLQIRDVNLSTMLQRSGRTLMTSGHPRLRRMLVVGQVALTLRPP